MKNFRLATLVLLCALAPAAHAGYRLQGGEVQIDPAHSWASGVLSGAYNSNDGSQWLGCMTASYNSGTSYGQCYARDAAQQYVGCSTSNTEMLRAIQSIKSDTYIYFTWDANGTCTML